jgi:hypothetical protein
MTVPLFRSQSRRARLSLQPLEGRDVPNGTITAALSPTGVLTLTGDDDDNVVTLKINTGTNVVLTPDGATTIDNLADSTAPVTGAAVTINGAVTSIKAKLNGGADVVSIDSTAEFSVSGAVSIALGDGNNQLILNTSGRISLGGITVTGGDGFDDVSVNGGAGSTVGGTAKFTVANGGSTVALTGIGFTAVTYTGGDAASVVNPNVVTGTNLVVAKTFSAGLGNSFPGTLDFTGSNLGALKATGFSVSSVLRTTTVNTNVTYKALFAADIQGDGLTVTKNVSVTAANASFGGSAGAIVVGGNLAVTGSAATTTSFQTTALSEVKGNLTIKGGLSNDVFETNANFKADKNVSLTLFGGDNTITLGDGTGLVTVGGKLTIKTLDGNDQILIDQVTATGPVSIMTKGGADVLSIEDGSRFNSTFTADLGAGDDEISVAQNTGVPGPPPVPGPTTFVGKAKFIAGTGNDVLSLGVAVAAGGDANSAVVFTDPTSSVDGGLGLNDFDPTTAQVNSFVLLNW